MSTSPVIVALDVATKAETRSLIAALGDSATFYKVGLELYTGVGMDFVRDLKSEGHRVFLDLKLYDIGETVKRAVAQVARAGADFLSVHGSRTIMEAAVARRGVPPASGDHGADQFRRERSAADGLCVHGGGAGRVARPERRRGGRGWDC